MTNEELESVIRVARERYLDAEVNRERLHGPRAPKAPGRLARIVRRITGRTDTPQGV